MFIDLIKVFEKPNLSNKLNRGGYLKMLNNNRKDYFRSLYIILYF